MAPISTHSPRCTNTFIRLFTDDAPSQVLPIVCKKKSPLLPRPPSRSRSSHRRKGNIPYGSVVRFWPHSPPSSRCGSQSRSTTSLDLELYTANVSKYPKTHDHSIPCITLLSSSSILLCNYYHLNILSPSLLFYFNVSVTIATCVVLPKDYYHVL